MSYFVRKGTRVTVRRPNAQPTDWFPHTLRKDLQFTKPIETTYSNYVFLFDGWRIRVRRNQVESEADAA